MAQTKKKRSRKHRGTQGGKVDDRPKGRPQNRAEAKARARSRRSGGSGKAAKGRSSARGAKAERVLQPPTWASAFRKGLIAAAIFFALLALAFQRPPMASAALAGFMLAFYVPMGYLTDRFFYQRRLRKEQQERAERAAGKNKRADQNGN